MKTTTDQSSNFIENAISLASHFLAGTIAAALFAMLFRLFSAYERMQRQTPESGS